MRTSGTKLWRYRYRIAGKENLFSIGEYGDQQPKISLADARTVARAARALVKQGIHPSHDRKLSKLAAHKENANTFEAVAVEWIERTKTCTTDYVPEVI